MTIKNDCYLHMLLSCEGAVEILMAFVNFLKRKFIAYLTSLETNRRQKHSVK